MINFEQHHEQQSKFCVKSQAKSENAPAWIRKKLLAKQRKLGAALDIQVYLQDWYLPTFETFSSDASSLNGSKPRGKDKIISISEKASIVDLKIVIATVMGVAYSSQILLYKERIVDELAQFSDYSIQHGDLIFVCHVDYLEGAFCNDMKLLLKSIPSALFYEKYKEHHSHHEQRANYIQHQLCEKYSTGKRILRKIVLLLVFLVRIRKCAGQTLQNLTWSKENEMQSKMVNIISKKSKNDQDRVSIAVWLGSLNWSKHFGISTNQLNEIASVLHMVRLTGGEFIFQQYDTADAMYFIMQGEVCITVQGIGRIALLRKHDHFGELSLLSDGKVENSSLRTASAICNIQSNGQETIVAKLDKVHYEKFVYQEQYRILCRKSSDLKRFAVFRPLLMSTSQEARLAYICRYTIYHANVPMLRTTSTLKNTDEPIDILSLNGLYLVVKGTVKVTVKIQDRTPFVFLVHAPAEFGLESYLPRSSIQKYPIYSISISTLSSKVHVLRVPSLQLDNLLSSFHNMRSKLEELYHRKMSDILERIAHSNDATISDFVDIHDMDYKWYQTLENQKAKEREHRALLQAHPPKRTLRASIQDDSTAAMIASFEALENGTKLSSFNALENSTKLPSLTSLNSNTTAKPHGLQSPLQGQSPPSLQNHSPGNHSPRKRAIFRKAI